MERLYYLFFVIHIQTHHRTLFHLYRQCRYLLSPIQKWPASILSLLLDITCFLRYIWTFFPYLYTPIIIYLISTKPLFPQVHLSSSSKYFFLILTSTYFYCLLFPTYFTSFNLFLFSSKQKVLTNNVNPSEITGMWALHSFNLFFITSNIRDRNILKNKILFKFLKAYRRFSQAVLSVIWMHFYGLNYLEN